MPIKILVVEDFEPFRVLIVKLLQRRAEFQVIGEAADGLEAVRKASDLQPDLILMDIGLPKLSGVQAAELIREQNPNARIVFVTQESSSVAAKAAFRAGAQGFVVKSGAHFDLLPAIDTVLGCRQFVSSSLEVTIPDTHPRHVAQFCSNESVLVETYTRFAAAALKADGAAIILLRQRHREALAEKLRGEGFDIDAAIQSGTFVSLDSAEMVMNNGVPDVPQFFERVRSAIDSATRATRCASPRISIGGECAGMVYADGHVSTALQIERASNALIKTQEIDILCAYSSHDGQEHDSGYKSICAEHSAVYSR